MTLGDLSNSTKCRYIVVGRRVVPLRPTGVFSLQEMVTMQSLLEQIQETADGLPTGMWLLVGHLWHPEYRKLRHLLREAVKLLTGYTWWSFWRLQRVLREATGYLQETTDKAGGGDDPGADLGLSIASLQRFYRGDQTRWYTMPLYQLSAYSEAIKELIKDSKSNGNQEVSQEEFAAIMHGMGMEGVYDDA